MFQIIVLAITVLVNLLLGLVVYLKNPRSVTNRYFFTLTAIFVMWSVVNYISVHPVFLGQLTWIRLSLFSGALLNLSVFVAFLAFPDTSFSTSSLKRLRWAALSTAFVMALTLTPLVFKSLKIDAHGVPSPVPAPGIGLFLAQTIILLGTCIMTVVKKFRLSKGVVREQLRLVLLGVAGTFSLIVFSNFIAVVAFHITALIPLGPSFTMIFSGCFAYAIVRHRLFDIRRAAARSLTYTLTIGFMALIYVAAGFGVSTLLFNQSGISARYQMVNTLLALLLAASFQPIKQFFDQLSRKVFYKDSYDPQAFLDRLNQALVEQADLSHLLKNCSTIIIDNLKSAGCTFVINETSQVSARLLGTPKAPFTAADSRQLQSLLRHTHTKVVAADESEFNDKLLINFLNSKDIAVIVQLVPSLRSKADSFGEILLGAKLSGDPYSREDIQLLEILANELVIAIQNALRFEEIENFNTTLQLKVINATKKLRSTNDKLRTLDETKDDFISMASHQLRTPLTSVKGYISLVLEGDAGKLTPLQKQMLEQAYTSSQRMVYLIADLLNVSRLKTGKFIIDSKPVNLAKIVNEEMAQLKETAKSRQLTLDYSQPEDFPEVMLDETKIRQVIMNFADNAIYYTPAGGKIKVELVNTPTTIELKIIDNGLGVPKAEQPHLFTKFYRAGNARKARPDGTGLGLFMAKKVIAAQGGALIFESTEGKGSTFGFVFSKHNLAVPETPVK